MVISKLLQGFYPEPKPPQKSVLWSERAAIVQIEKGVEHETACWRVRPRHEEVDLFLIAIDLSRYWRDEGFSYSSKAPGLPTHEIQVILVKNTNQTELWSGRFDFGYHRVLLSRAAKKGDHCVHKVLELLARVLLYEFSYHEMKWHEWTSLLCKVCSAGNLTDAKTKDDMKKQFNLLLPKHRRDPRLEAFDWSAD